MGQEQSSTSSLSHLETSNVKPRAGFPSEIWLLIDEFSDFKTHVILRQVCTTFRKCMSLRKFVTFDQLQNLVLEYKLDSYSYFDNAKRRTFQERIHWDIKHDVEVSQAQLLYLCQNYLEIEICRLTQAVLDHPEKYSIDLGADDSFVLSSAASTGNLPLYQRLLVTIPKLNPSGNGNYAVRYASENGHVELVKILLKDARVDPTTHDQYCIRFASQNGHTETARVLLADSRVDPSGDDQKAIQQASSYGHFEIVKMLLQDTRVDPTVDDNYSFRFAAARGHLQVVLALAKDSRVDPGAFDNFAIWMASRNGHADIVHALLSMQNVDPSARANTCLFWAAKNGHFECCKVLISDPRVNASALDHAAIRAASYNHHFQIVKLLLAPLKTEKGDQLLNWASRHKLHQLVSFLLKDPTFKVPYTQVVECVKTAIERGSKEVFELFLEDERCRGLVCVAASSSTDLLEIALMYSQFDIFEAILALQEGDVSAVDA